MQSNSDLSYFNNGELVNFSFFCIPRTLMKDEQFRSLSTDAKLLYGMLLDRMGLSARNGWHDDAGRIYIYYTVKEVCETMGCGRNKAMSLLAALDTNKGIGLIERIRQGQGKPDKIYVKRINVQEDTGTSATTTSSSTAPISEVDFSDVQRSENPTSRSRENRPLEVSKADPNKTDINQTYFIQTNLSIYPQNPPRTRWMDRYEQRENHAILSHQGQALLKTAHPATEPRTAPLAALSKQVCHLVAQMTLVRGHSPLIPLKICLAMRHERNGQA